MSALRGHVASYLNLRRALGFKLEREGQLLSQWSPTSRRSARPR
jgi:hypothetical protein